MYWFRLGTNEPATSELQQQQESAPGLGEVTRASDTIQEEGEEEEAAGSSQSNQTSSNTFKHPADSTVRPD